MDVNTNTGNTVPASPDHSLPSGAQAEYDRLTALMSGTNPPRPEYAATVRDLLAATTVEEQRQILDAAFTRTMDSALGYEGISFAQAFPQTAAACSPPALLADSSADAEAETELEAGA